MNSKHGARWWIHEDDEDLFLQIELTNDCAVTLSCPKTGDPPNVCLWTGNGEMARGITLNHMAKASSNGPLEKQVRGVINALVQI